MSMAGDEAPATDKVPTRSVQAPAVLPLLRPFVAFEAVAFGVGTGAANAFAAGAFVARLAFTIGVGSTAFIAGAGCAFAARRGLATLTGAGLGSDIAGAAFADRFVIASFFGAAFVSATATALGLPRLREAGIAFGAGATFLGAATFFSAGAGTAALALGPLLAAFGAAFSGAAFTALVFAVLPFVALGFDALALGGFADLAAIFGAGGFIGALGTGSATASLAADFLAGFGAAAPLLADFDDARRAIACARRATGVFSAIHSTPFT